MSKNHTANYLASKFLNSKRSLKKVYGLNASHITILRYICDSIDMNYSKRKQFNTKLYQSQISKYSRNSLRTTNNHIGYLIKKRLIVCIDTKKRIYSIGKVLEIYATIAYPIEVRNGCVPHRSTQPLRISNALNVINRTKKSLPVDNSIQRKSDNFDKPSQNGKISTLLADYLKDMSSKGRH